MVSLLIEKNLVMTMAQKLAIQHKTRFYNLALNSNGRL